MTGGGIVFMVVSWTAIIGLCAWCFLTIFRVNASKHLVAPLEIDTEPREGGTESPRGSS